MILEVRILTDENISIKCSWPSGPRRQIKALVSKEAWVQTPPNTNFFPFFYFFLPSFFTYLFGFFFNEPWRSHGLRRRGEECGMKKAVAEPRRTEKGVRYVEEIDF